MANAIVVFPASKKLNKNILERIKLSCMNILPENMENHNLKIKKFNDIIVGITGFNEAITLTESGLLLGKVFNSYEDTWYRLTTQPDGSYCIFRWNDEFIELLSDVGSTRTLWYYTDKHYFIASTSQRMIITFLGSFKINKSVFPWMMSTGSIGPYNSWDKRIHCLNPDTKIVYNKKTRKIKHHENNLKFNEIKRNKNDYKLNLEKCINQTFENIHFNYTDYYLPLSGGLTDKI